METLVDDFVMDQVAEMTPGYVGADLNLLCREAIYLSAPVTPKFRTAYFVISLKTNVLTGLGCRWICHQIDNQRMENGDWAG